MEKRKRSAPPGCYWRGNVLYAQVKVGGRRHQRCLHTDEAVAAIRLREKWRKELSDQHHHGIEPKRTFEQVRKEWAPHAARNLSPKTALRYSCSLKQIEQYVDDKTLDQINGRLIAKIIDDRVEMGVTNATIRRDLQALSVVFNFAIKRGYVESNPVLPQMRQVKERRDPISLPNPVHIALVRSRCPPGLGRMVDAALATGCREEELTKSLCGDVDHARRQVWVVGKRNKGRTIDLVPFNGYQPFSERSAIGSAPVFYHHGAHGKETTDRLPYKNASVVSHRFAEVVAATAAWAKHNGVDFRPFTLHHIRHRHAVDWLKSGRSLYDLKERLGHTRVSTTEIYLEYLTSDEKKVVMHGAATSAATRTE
jgi:integrase/recombinase XerD